MYTIEIQTSIPEPSYVVRFEEGYEPLVVAIEGNTAETLQALIDAYIAKEEARVAQETAEKEAKDVEIKAIKDSAEAVIEAITDERCKKKVKEAPKDDIIEEASIDKNKEKDIKA